MWAGDGGAQGLASSYQVCPVPDFAIRPDLLEQVEDAAAGESPVSLTSQESPPLLLDLRMF